MSSHGRVKARSPSASSSRISSRTSTTHARRARLDRSQSMRRVDAVVAPDPLALRGRVAALRFLITLVLLALAGRSAWLCVGEDDRLSRRVASQQQQIVEIAPQRGSIVDRLGTALAISVEVDTVFADPGMVQDAEQAADYLAPLLELDRDALLEKLTREDTRFVRLARWVPGEVGQAVREARIQGVRVMVEPRRRYPSGGLAAQILGITGADGQGLEGLEAVFNDELMGDGVEYQVLPDHGNRTTNYDALLARRATEGDTLVLTLDHGIQHRAEQSLAAAIKRHEAAAGWLVMIDVDTGGILAMVSQPGFNPNDFGGSSRDSRRNRAISEVYEPGSVMKPFVIAEVLERGLATAQEEIFCEKGSYRIGRRTIHDSHAHEMLTVSEIIKVSSNIGTAKLAERLGAPDLEATFRRYGFGSKTHLGLYGEERGLLSPARTWSRVGLANRAFGQGIGVTGVQLASAFAALVNGGSKVKPHLVSEVRGLDGAVKADLRPEPDPPVLSEETSQLIRRILATVMEKGGTGGRARLEEYSSGGKTGTAQKVKDGRYARGLYVSSFIGFAPVDKPRVVTLVTLDEPHNKHYGGTVAGPVFKEVTTYALQVLGVQPDLQPEQDEAVAEEAQPEPEPEVDEALPRLEPTDEGWTLPDLAGLSARDVLSVLADGGLRVEVIGSGLVASQQPEAGAAVRRGDAIVVALADRSSLEQVRRGRR